MVFFAAKILKRKGHTPDMAMEPCGTMWNHRVLGYETFSDKPI